MPVTVDPFGVLTVTSDPATQGLAGRIFKRRTPQGDAADYVVALGVVDVGGDSGPCAELVIATTTFGAVPDGWDAATVTFDLGAFAEQYMQTNPAEVATLTLAAKAAAKPAEKRESPWSRS